jgi:hypothetical protein
MDRNAAGVGGDQGAGRAVLLHVGVHLLLDVKAFDHHFNDPITVLDLREVVVEVASADALGEALVVDGRGVALEREGQSVVDDLVARRFVFAVHGLFGHDIQQQHFGSHVREQACNA